MQTPNAPGRPVEKSKRGSSRWRRSGYLGATAGFAKICCHVSGVMLSNAMADHQPTVISGPGLCTHSAAGNWQFAIE